MGLMNSRSHKQRGGRLDGPVGRRPVGESTPDGERGSSRDLVRARGVGSSTVGDHHHASAPRRFDVVHCAPLNDEKEIIDDTALPKLKMFKIEYKGPPTENYVRRMLDKGAPIKPIFTTRKLKTMVSNLKEKIPKDVLSNLIYKYDCPCKEASYIGLTKRHLKYRVEDHRNGIGSQTLTNHTKKCKNNICIEDFSILHMNTGNEYRLKILEALYIRTEKPTLDIQNDHSEHTLAIKL